MAAHRRRKVFEGFQCGNRGEGGSWGNRGMRGCSPGPGNGRSVDAEGSTARIGDELRAALEDGPL